MLLLFFGSVADTFHPSIHSMHIYEVVTCSALVQWCSTLAAHWNHWRALKTPRAGLPSAGGYDVTDSGDGLDVTILRSFPGDCNMRSGLRAPKIAQKTKGPLQRSNVSAPCANPFSFSPLAPDSNFHLQEEFLKLSFTYAFCYLEYLSL